MLEAILLVIAGILAIPSKKLKKSDSENKVSPYRGWIGLIIMIWGIWSLISVIRYSDILLDYGYISLWALSISIAVIATVLGFILALNLISYVSKSSKLIESLLPLQKFFGIIAIILGVIAFVYIFIFPLYY